MLFRKLEVKVGAKVAGSLPANLLKFRDDCNAAAPHYAFVTGNNGVDTTQLLLALHAKMASVQASGIKVDSNLPPSKHKISPDDPTVWIKDDKSVRLDLVVDPTVAQLPTDAAPAISIGYAEAPKP